MAPTRTRTRRAADVWLDDTLWAEPDRSRRPRDGDASGETGAAVHADIDLGPATDATAPAGATVGIELPAFYDHEVEPTVRRAERRPDRDRREDGTPPPRSAGDVRARRVSGPRPAERAPDAHAAAEEATREAEPPVTPSAAAEGAEVPGLLRRPLVEVQRTVPAAADRRERLRQPDVIALWAVGLAVVVLLAAILTANSAA